MIKQIVYTNSKCSDVFKIFYNQNKKYTNLDLLFISDSNKFIESDDDKIYIYNNMDDYWSTWVKAIEKFNLKNFIYLQEDFFLYNYVNEKEIINLTNYLNNSEYSYIRLIKSGHLNEIKIENNLYEIEPSNVNNFSMQATIWKSDDYLKIMNGVKEKKWFESINYYNFIYKNNIKGLYYYCGEPKRGNVHFDSSIYPYIATAIVKGKWNLSEYNNELLPLIKEHDININNRGIF